MENGRNIEHMEDHEVLVLSLESPAVFEILVNRYQDAFLRKILAIVKNKEDAQDIVQDTFVKIYVHARKFKVQEGASFKSWAYRILLNTCFSFCKKMKREKDFVSAVEPEILQSFGGGKAEEEKKLDLDHFLFVVSKLPVTMANILKKTVFEGKTHDDIAEEEGISAGAVRTRLHRARKEFKKVDSLYTNISQKYE